MIKTIQSRYKKMRSRFDAGYQFGLAFWGWLRWCWHGLPRRQECAECGEVQTWTYGPHGQRFCSDKCAGAICF